MKITAVVWVYGDVSLSIPDTNMSVTLSIPSRSFPIPSVGLCDPEQMHSHVCDEKDFYLSKGLTTGSLELHSEFAHVFFPAGVMRLGNFSPEYSQDLSINHVSEESEIMPTPQESLWQKRLCWERKGKSTGPKMLTECNERAQPPWPLLYETATVWYHLRFNIF